MGNPAGVRRDFGALEKRRLDAMRLIESGLNQSEAGRRLKVARQTVVRWVAEYRKRGKEGLRGAGRAGRKPRLSDTKRARLERLLVRGPEALGYGTSQWTCPSVAHLIEQEFGIRYHEGHVWKILVELGWRPPRSASRTRI